MAEMQKLERTKKTSGARVSALDYLKHRIVISLGRSILLGVLMAVIACPRCFVYPDQYAFAVLRYYILTFFLIWEFSYFISERIYTHKKVERLAYRQVIRSVIKSTLIFIPLNFIYVYFRFKVIAFEPDSWDSWSIWYFNSINIAYFLILTLYFNYKYVFDAFKAMVLSKEIEEKERINAELMALRNQVDPHFLFNNLNILSQLVHESAERSEIFISQLAKVYRCLLDKNEESLVLIEDEIELLKAYLYLIKTRFQNSLRIDFDESRFHNFKIAPLVLQMLVENAIKHNRFSSDEPLDIKIWKTSDYVLVENKVRPMPIHNQPSGLGLKNIIRRYSLLNANPVRIQESDSKFVVEVPVIKLK